METHEKQFHPESVDAEIDQFLQIDHQEEMNAQPGIRLVHEMSQLYLEESRVLDRARRRLSQQMQTSSRETPASVHHAQTKKEKRLMENQAIPGYKKNRMMKRLSGIGLGLVAALILASLVTVLHAHQQSRTTSGTGAPTASTAPTYGHVVYSAQKEYGSSSVSWSSDGQRVAVVRDGTNAVGGGTVEIWDALTGQHRVSVELSPNEVLSEPQAWSPKGELLAVATSERVLIINGQSGKIVLSYWANSVATASAGTVSTASAMAEGPTTKMNPLSYHVPLSSAASFRSIAWSADGKSIASVYSSGAGADGPAVIQIWNPFTGKALTSLTTEPGWSIGDISWSPDGVDIAADLSNVGSLSQNQVRVWNVQKQQIIFQQPLNQPVVGSLWQPGSHNLAFSLLPDESYNAAILQIWNVQTRQRIKSLNGIAANTMAWSPDGKEIAYDNRVGGGSTAGVTILDMNTSQKVYTYSVSAQSNQSVDISIPAWSPDGKYIVTSQSTTSTPTGTPSNSLSVLPTQPSSVVKVWIA